MTMIKQTELTIATQGRGLLDITTQVNQAVHTTKASAGLCHLFIQHTSASLIVSENADPDVLTDLESYMAKLVKDGDPEFAHTLEGPDDMSAHVRSVLTATGLSIPVKDGQLKLGRWQAIYLWEHRYSPKQRTVTVTIVAGD